MFYGVVVKEHIIVEVDPQKLADGAHGEGHAPEGVRVIDFVVAVFFVDKDAGVPRDGDQVNVTRAEIGVYKDERVGAGPVLFLGFVYAHHKKQKFAFYSGFYYIVFT